MSAYRDSLPPEQRERYDQAIKEAGKVLAASDLAMAQMTPREQAEAAWTPTSRYSVDELEELIRAERGMPPIDRGGDAPPS